MSKHTLKTFSLKYLEIINLCKVATTNKSDLETKLLELEEIENKIDKQKYSKKEIPEEMEDFSLFIDVEVERSTKIQLHYSLLSLIELRKKQVGEINKISYENAQLYNAENEQLEQYIKSVISSCNVMNCISYISKHYR